MTNKALDSDDKFENHDRQRVNLRDMSVIMRMFGVLISGKEVISKTKIPLGDVKKENRAEKITTM